MFGEFFLPDMAGVAWLFGLVYYGCCEPMDDRWPLIGNAIPNIRAVSISAWNDQPKIAALLGKDYVYSRQPVSAPMSGDPPDWEALERDLDATLAAAKDSNGIPVNMLFYAQNTLAGSC